MLSSTVKCLLSLALAVLPLSCDRPAPPPAQEPSPPPVAAAKSPGASVRPTAPRPRAGELQYIERILGSARPDDTLPMIIAIHGLGDDPEHFAQLFDGLPVSARLIALQGIDPAEGGGWSWFPQRARSKDVDALAAGIGSAADKVAAAIEQLRRSRPTQGKPLVTGFSQGGMLTFALAVKHPEQVGFAAPVGGWLPPPLWPAGAPRAHHPKIVALHGTADTAVPFAPTEQAVADLQRKGFAAELRAYEGVQHAIPAEVRTTLYDLLTDAAAETGQRGT